MGSTGPAHGTDTAHKGHEGHRRQEGTLLGADGSVTTRLHAVRTGRGRGKPSRGSQVVGPGVSSRVALPLRPSPGPPVVLTPQPRTVLSHSSFQNPGVGGTARGTGVPRRREAPRPGSMQGCTGLSSRASSRLCTTGGSPPHRPASLSVSTGGRPPPHSGPESAGLAPTRGLRGRAPRPA